MDLHQALGYDFALLMSYNRDKSKYVTFGMQETFDLWCRFVDPGRPIALLVIIKAVHTRDYLINLNVLHANAAIFHQWNKNKAAYFNKKTYFAVQKYLD